MYKVLTPSAIIMFEDDKLEEIDFEILLYNKKINHYRKKIEKEYYKQTLKRKLPIVYEIGLQKRNY